MSIPEEALRAVTNRASLFAFLRDRLHWPVDPEDTFTYEGPRLDGEAAARAEVSQIVPFTAGDPFTIMLVEFATAFRRTDLREILRRIREDIRKRAKYEGRALDEIVFVCATEDYKGIRFAHFETRDKGLPRLRVFGYDRGQADGTRTLRDFNFPALVLPRPNVLGEADWTEGRARWMSAWDVEQVTNAFFRRYKEVFNAAQAYMDGIDGEDGRLCAQRLFNRLLFIRFLEKKGWLTFQGRGDYLRALWEDYQAKKPEGGVNFYNSRLKPLFFAALNKPHVRDGQGDTWLTGLIGAVPYLNGGLFDDAEDKAEAECHPNLLIQDDALAPVVTDFFYAYNFTVTESTPDDVEVAVDPEMLGKVFEELVTAGERHGTGSYYTPRGIVSFMCREALKGYLGGYADLVDERDADGISKKQAEELIGRLKAVKVVDPAGGSGAYVLGMLHELFDLIGLLEVRADPMTPQGKYRRKLEIIQNCLYAVDKEPFAVNIARLRLWLSLAVEFEGDTPEPLPNLDFKVEAGDSLTAPSPQITEAQVDARADLIRRFEALKRDFGDPYYKGSVSKPDLKKQIDALRADIALWTHAGKAVAGFDWRVEFCEVFQRPEPVADIGGALNLGGTLSEPASPGGFDIVLANPPYVRMELFKDQKPILKKNFPQVHSDRADLYCYFYDRALQLLRPGGILAFISPNKWFRAIYGANLRNYLAGACEIQNIVDFGDLPVFQSATAYPAIFIARKGKSCKPPTFTAVTSLSPPYPDISTLVQQYGKTLPINALNGADWRFSASFHSSTARPTIMLGEMVKGEIFRGIVTGLNAAFYINGRKRAELISQSPKSRNVIKPLVIGEDVRIWSVTDKDHWLIYMHHGIDVSGLDAVLEHLVPYRERLEARATRQKWYELQQPQARFAPYFERAKIIYPQIMIQPRFTYDTSGSYINQKCFMIRTDDRYLLGILNSATLWKMILEGSPMLRGGYTEPRRELMLSLPIPDAPEMERDPIAALVQKCLDAKGIGCEAWEQEINDRVAALYGL